MSEYAKEDVLVSADWVEDHLDHNSTTDIIV